MNESAVILREFNSLNGIKVEEYELGVLEEDMVEVKVQYCGVNFADFYTIHGMAGAELPRVLGIECAGIVTDVGSSLVPFKIGDKVICYNYKGGLHRSTVRISHKNCYLIPEHCTLKTAAAIFVNYVTAWCALYPLGKLQDGDSLFVSSCGGGVGLAIVELIKSTKNVNIYGTASSSKREFLQSRGVNFVEYNELESLDRKFDLVIESMSSLERKILMSKLNPFGKIVVIGAKGLIPSGANTPDSIEDPNVNITELIFRNITIAGLHIGILAEEHPNLIRAALTTIFDEVRPESLQIKTYPFANAKSAYEEFADRKNIGKTLLEL